MVASFHQALLKMEAVSWKKQRNVYEIVFMGTEHVVIGL